MCAFAHTHTSVDGCGLSGAPNIQIHKRTSGVHTSSQEVEFQISIESGTPQFPQTILCTPGCEAVAENTSYSFKREQAIFHISEATTYFEFNRAHKFGRNRNKCAWARIVQPDTVEMQTSLRLNVVGTVLGLSHVRKSHHLAIPRISKGMPAAHWALSRATPSPRVCPDLVPDPHPYTLNALNSNQRQASSHRKPTREYDVFSLMPTRPTSLTHPHKATRPFTKPLSLSFDSAAHFPPSFCLRPSHVSREGSYSAG